MRTVLTNKQQTHTHVNINTTTNLSDFQMEFPEWKLVLRFSLTWGNKWERKEQKKGAVTSMTSCSKSDEKYKNSHPWNQRWIREAVQNVL